jgi:hypothetical protein
MSDITAKEFVPVLDRAIKLVDTFVPVNDRNPTPGGGNVRTTAVSILVAARAMLEALVEHEAANPKSPGEQK